MEAAPLTLAHTHARNAVLETKRHNAVAASEEHDLAAAEFASAAQDSSDKEVIRILNLLEEHHKKLSHLLRYRHDHPEEQPSSPTPVPEASTQKYQGHDPTRPNPSDATPTPKPKLPRTTRASQREMASSISSHLASARGIPNPRQKRATPVSPTLSNQHADGRFSQEDARTSSPPEPQDVSRPSWAPPTPTTGPQPATSPPTGPTSDLPFQRFYSTFENLVTKLSAPLAFTSLPLTSPATSKDTSMPPPPSKPIKPVKPSKADTNPPDYSQLISRAALRAVHSNNSNPTTFNPAESFYIVPTTGGTISYADLLSRPPDEKTTLRYHHRHTSHLSQISEIDDSFVDAHSNFPAASSQPPSTTSTPHRHGHTTEPKYQGKTMEEYHLENAALKHLSDTLSKRLHLFEMSSQASTAAMAQSIRSMPPRSPEQSARSVAGAMVTPAVTTRGRSKPTDNATAPSVGDAEDLLRRKLDDLETQARRKEQENERLRATLGKYKDKWDTLKQGAKERRAREVQMGGGPVGGGKERDGLREAQRERAGGGGGSTGSGGTNRRGRSSTEETIDEVPES